MIIEDFIVSLFIILIIVVLLIIFLKLIYKTYVVKAKLVKIVDRGGNLDLAKGQYMSNDTYHYSFKTKSGKLKTKSFGGYIFIKKGDVKKILYSEERDELVGKVRTPFVLGLIIYILFSGIFMSSFEIAVILILSIFLTVFLYIKFYNRKYRQK